MSAIISIQYRKRTKGRMGKRSRLASLLNDFNASFVQGCTHLLDFNRFVCIHTNCKFYIVQSHVSKFQIHCTVKLASHCIGFKVSTKIPEYSISLVLIKRHWSIVNFSSFKLHKVLAKTFVEV